MNDPNKVINVNLSSLLSLKAELLRKQAEVNKAKVVNAASTSSKLQEYTSHKSLNKSMDCNGEIMSRKSKDKKKYAKEIEKTSESIIYGHEDAALLEKSQRVLEAKAKFYERMQKSGGKLNSDDNCLVMFNKKKQESKDDSTNYKERNRSSSENSSSSEDYDSDHHEVAEDEWVEYTDCLGRTRTCLKRDLAEIKRKDEKLAASMPERLDQSKANWMIDTAGSHIKSLHGESNKDDDDDDMIGPMPAQSLYGDGLSTVSKLEEQKANWERKEQENLEKTDVHYQDVFFDEARQHGVGYYAFSTDEEERKKQQKELEKARQRTLEEQKRREILREQREKIIAERVLAAKNRQRARLGLEPLKMEEFKEKKSESEAKVEETKEERKTRKKAEKLEKKRMKEEEEREKERLNHIRPWDREKDGVPHKNFNNGEDDGEWQYKPEREPMSQAQWNEYKRKERISEFAPPPTPLPKETPLKRTNFKSSYNSNPVTNYNNVPPPAAVDTGFSQYQSTKKPKIFKKRNCTETTDEKDEELLSSSSSLCKRGACIPPPSNMEDFHLPSHNKKSKTSHELEKSIEAGLCFLRNNCDKEMAAKKSSWTAKIDY